MAKRYKIHPGLGIARIGNSPSGFFVAAETPGSAPVEIGAGGQEAVLTHYKDAQGRLKRQGTRFRVFEYEVDAAGERLLREITGVDAVITWTVELANTKAAGNALVDAQGGQLLFPDGPPRNPDANRADLAITPTLPPISGPDRSQAEAPSGRYRGKAVKIGELRTDSAGRLIVLGGQGVSESYPTVSPIVTFANNADWHDDVADGPVDATLTFPGQAPIAVDYGSWVVVAPPDFAPAVQGLASIYDVACSAIAEANWPPAAPSYQLDILPILKRAVNLRWAQKYPYWNGFPKAFDVLGAKGAAGDAARAMAYAKLIDIEQSQKLLNFHFTRLQRQHLDDWKAGNFADDYDPAPPAPVFGPESLDRAALEPCVGGGWYPGIEAGVLLTTPALWSELCRPTRAAFDDRGHQVTPRAGYLTERMACPWQADFFECAGAWWPAQRPDKVFVGMPPGSTAQDWIAGIASHEDLVANFWKLGILTSAGNAPDGLPAYLETERDASLPHQV